MPVNGLVTMTPTSVDKSGSGSTATINTNGSVTFSTCTGIGLNGVFTSSYDNYMIVMRHSGTATGAIYVNWRASGVDNSTSNSYVYEYLNVNSTTLNASRQTTSRSQITNNTDLLRAGTTTYVFGPYLSQATAYRSTSVTESSSGAITYDIGGTHNQTASYDGFNFTVALNTFTGLITVYGFNQ